MSFQFQQFHIDDTHCAMKVGTDGVLLGAWARLDGAERVLDLGCGSGLIALMAAQRQPTARVVGVEIDADAVADARRNVAASPFAERVEIVEADVVRWRRVEAGLDCFDCILANPPYFEEDLLPPAASRAQARHTQGGGLTFAALLRVVDEWLTPAGDVARFCVVLPASARTNFSRLAELHGLHLVRETEVVTRPGKPAKRVLLEWRRAPLPLVRDTLVLVGDDGRRSEDYEALCREFYLQK